MSAASVFGAYSAPELVVKHLSEPGSFRGFRENAPCAWSTCGWMLLNSVVLIGWVALAYFATCVTNVAAVSPARELLVVCGLLISMGVCRRQFETTQTSLGRTEEFPIWATLATVPWTLLALWLDTNGESMMSASHSAWAAAALPTTMFVLPWAYTVAIAVWNTLDGISSVAHPKRQEEGFSESVRTWFDDVAYPWKELGFTLVGDYEVRKIVPHRVRWLRSRDGVTWVSCETVEFAPGMTFRAQSTWTLLGDGSVCSVSDSGRLGPAATRKDRLVDLKCPGHAAAELWTTHAQLIATVVDDRQTRVAIVDCDRVVWFERYVELITFERMIARGQVERNPYEGMELDLRMELLDVLSIPHTVPQRRHVEEAQMLPVLAGFAGRRPGAALALR